MKHKLAVLVAALLGLSGMLTTVEAISLNIDVGDRGFYTHGGITAFIIVGFQAIGGTIISSGFTATTSFARAKSYLDFSFSRSPISIVGERRVGGPSLLRGLPLFCAHFGGKSRVDFPQRAKFS